MMFKKILNATKHCLHKCIFCVNYLIKCFKNGIHQWQTMTYFDIIHQSIVWGGVELLRQILIDNMMFNCKMKINIVWNIRLYRDYEKQTIRRWQMSTHSPVKTCLQISIQTLTVISRVCIIAIYSIILHINDGTLHVQVSIVVHAEL